MTWTLSAFADEAGRSSDEQIAAMKKGGVSHVDLRRVDGHRITQLPPEVAENVQKKFSQAGVQVSMFGSPIGKIDVADDVQGDLDSLDHLGRLKDVFGCNAVRMFSYYNKSGVAPERWEAESLDRLKRLRDRAGQLGLVLYHENESDIFGDHPENVLKVAELRNGETFRLIYDFANYIRTGVSCWESWQMFKDKTDCFHLKDQKLDGQHTPMGGGDTDALRILKDAVSRGWSGPCAIEPHLTHSKAVVATGSSGSGDQSLADMSSAQTFQIACEGAHEILRQAGADYR